MISSPAIMLPMVRQHKLQTFTLYTIKLRVVNNSSRLAPSPRDVIVNVLGRSEVAIEADSN